MFDTIKYSGIITKSKALRARLISDEEYRHILSMSNVSEIIAYLREHPGYKPIFQYAEDNISHRGQLELLLDYSLYHDYLKLYRFADAKQRKLLKLFSKKIEAALIKAALRAVYSGGKIPKYTSMLEFVNKHSKVNFEALYNSKSPKDFINALADTSYYPLVCNLDLDAPNAMFMLESTIDIAYFSTIWKLREKTIKGSSLELMSDIVGSEMDLLNITWLYRCKKYYRVDNNRLYGFIIPHNYRLKKSDLSALIEASSVTDFLEALKKTAYYSGKHPFDIDNPERGFYRFLFNAYKDKIKNTPISMAPVMDFLYRKEVEIDLLTTIIECVRYDVSSADAVNYLDRYDKSSIIK